MSARKLGGLGMRDVLDLWFTPKGAFHKKCADRQHRRANAYEEKHNVSRAILRQCLGHASLILV
jgi:hypothetical protein